MLYQRSLSIESRLHEVLKLVRSGRYSTPAIAEKVGVSVPTVSRDLMALRERGHDIRAVRRDGEWKYILGKQSSAPRQTNGARAGRKLVTA